MKLDGRRIAKFLAEPGSCRVVLLHGGDAGLVRERGRRLALAVAGQADDPFRVVELGRDGFSRIADEMAAQPMTGGRRVVCVRDVTDAASAAVKLCLTSKADGFVILEAGELTSRSKLRAIIEDAHDAASIACYNEEGAQLSTCISSKLAQMGLRADADAVAYLADHLGGDFGATDQELTKLGLYMGQGTSLDLNAVVATIGDLAGLQIDDALFAATEGDVTKADRALRLAFSEGASPVGILRNLLVHLQRLERLLIGIEGGLRVELAIQSMRPPASYRHRAALARIVRLWRRQELGAACTRTFNAELACKQSNAPAVALCAHTVLSIAINAARRSARRSTLLEQEGDD